MSESQLVLVHHAAAVQVEDVLRFEVQACLKLVEASAHEESF